jgi:protein SCO1/2
MKRLQDAWKGNPDFKLVSFTVDPKQDTVEVLRKYAENFQAEPGQWYFLTGEKSELFKTAKDGFKVTAMEDPEGKPGFEFIHTTRLSLVDAKGMIRGFYDGQEEEDMKKLLRDAKYLMSSGGKS